MPNAELHINGGSAVYGLAGTRRAQLIEEALAHADPCAKAGVRYLASIGRALANALLGARVMLYRGDPGEAFYLALAEAQAMGVPAVVGQLGATAEPLIDEVTGTIARTTMAFASRRSPCCATTGYDDNSTLPLSNGNAVSARMTLPSASRL